MARQSSHKGLELHKLLTVVGAAASAIGVECPISLLAPPLNSKSKWFLSSRMSGPPMDSAALALGAVQDINETAIATASKRITGFFI